MAAKGVNLGGQRVARGDDIGAVDDKVGASGALGGLAGGGHPGMNPGADAGGAGAAEDGGDGGFKLRGVVAIGLAETAGQIVRTDEHRIEAVHGEDFVERGEGGRALDVDDK